MEKNKKYIFPIFSEFNNNVLRLISGSAIGNILIITTIPFITRLYKPDQFGLAQQFISYIAICVSITTLSYHIAIPLPKFSNKSKNLIYISFFLSLLMTTIIIFNSFFDPFEIFTLNTIKPISSARFLFPIILFLSSALIIAEHLMIRLKAFGKLALSRATKALSMQVTTIAIGLLTGSYLGIICGYATGILVALCILISPMMKFITTFKGEKTSFINDMREYKKFPLYKTPSVFFNSISNELPILLLACYHPSESIGFYTIALRLLKVPLSLFSNSFYEVYFQNVSNNIHEHKGDSINIFLSTIKKMMAISIVYIILIIIIATPLSENLLGSHWSNTDFMLRVLSIWIFFEVSYNSISSTFIICNRLEILLLLNITLLIFRFSLLITMNESVIAMVTSLSFVSAAFYILYIYIAYVIIKRKSTN